MKTTACGIIAEYNPFHNGHKHHLEESRNLSGAEVVVCAMSGNFTERGDISIVDKWKKAEMAVRNGIDLVVEIPTLFATANGGLFAQSAVDILENLGCDTISFGSECGKIEPLQQIAALLNENKEYIEGKVKEYKKEGYNYPRARQEALREILLIKEGNPGGCAAYDIDWILNPISCSNNLLAVEYIRCMKTARPITIERIGGYMSRTPENEYIASAVGIRDFLGAGKDVSDYLTPESSAYLEELKEKGQKLSFHNDMFDPIRHELITKSKDELNTFFGAEEGLGSLMHDGCRLWENYHDMVSELRTKAYTKTRVQRTLLHVLLGIRRDDVLKARNYIRVLAFNEKGAAYLKEVKKENRDNEDMLPVITNINKEAERYPEILDTLKVDILAADIYNEIAGQNLYDNSEFVKYPLKIEI